MSEMYKQGNVLKSTIRSDKIPLFIMVLEDAAYNLTATGDQFSAVVLHDCSKGSVGEPGQVANNWNKSKWGLSNIDEIENSCICRFKDNKKG